jgi:hypothetical protein
MFRGFSLASRGKSCPIEFDRRPVELLWWHFAVFDRGRAAVACVTPSSLWYGSWGAVCVPEPERKKSSMSGYGGVWRNMASVPLVAGLLALSGCSVSDDGLSRLALAGTVLLDGRQLDHGSILFMPENRPTKGDTAAATGDMIVNGRFVIPRRKGLTPGMYKIMIYSPKDRQQGEKGATAERAGNPGPPAEEMIPSKFNSQTELELEFNEGIKDLKIEIHSK